MKKCVLIIMFALSYNLGQSQSHGLQSVFIYSFTRHIVWPDAYNQGDFEILVVGDSPILEKLNEMAQKKKVGERAIRVTRINSADEIRKCNMLYLPAGRSAELSQVIAKANDLSILIITEEPGLGHKGSDINFIMKDGKLAFELNQAAAVKHNLKILNSLTSLAILI